MEGVQDGGMSVSSPGLHGIIDRLLDEFGRDEGEVVAVHPLAREYLVGVGQCVDQVVEVVLLEGIFGEGGQLAFDVLGFLEVFGLEAGR